MGEKMPPLSHVSMSGVLTELLGQDTEIHLAILVPSVAPTCRITIALRKKNVFSPTDGIQTVDMLATTSLSNPEKKNHNIQYSWWTKSCTTKDDDYPILYRVLTIPRWCRICSIKCISPFLGWSQGAPNRPSLPLLEGTIPANARLAVTCHRWDGTMHGIGHGIISMYARAWKNHLRANQLATNDIRRLYQTTW